MRSNILIGHSTSEEIRYKSSSGGIGYEITRYLFTNAGYSTAICFVFNKLECCYQPQLVYSIDKISNTGSIYQDINVYSFVKDNINKIKGKLVVSAPPCQVDSIRKLCLEHQINVFIISFCCSGQVSLEGTWMYYKLMGIRKEEVKSIKYRGDGWPSGIKIVQDNGKEYFRPNYTYPWNSIVDSLLFKPARCFYCKKDSSITSDVNLADPWLKRYIEADKIGNTMFFANTIEGQEIINLMIQEDFIKVEQSSETDYMIAQKPNIEKAERVSKNINFIKAFMKLYKNKYYRKFCLRNRYTMKINQKIINLMKRIYVQ